MEGGRVMNEELEEVKFELDDEELFKFEFVGEELLNG